MLCFSCKTKVSNHVNEFKSENYISYFLTVEKAKEFYKVNEHKKSFLLLDSLFTIYKPLNTLTLNEIELYCELAIKYKKTNKISNCISILVSDYGFDLANNKDSLWVLIKKESKFNDHDLKMKYDNFLKGINQNLRDSIIAIFKSDIDIRKTKNSIMMDSVDRINELKTVSIIKKYGFPTVKLIGGHNNDNELSGVALSVLLKHISYKYVKEIQPILIDEVKKGKCPPIVYAGMLDVRKVIRKEETDFTYFGTIKNIPPIDSTATNLARENIGLPKFK